VTVQLGDVPCFQRKAHRTTPFINRSTEAGGAAESIAGP
jgi:hypothetical protein